MITTRQDCLIKLKVEYKSPGLGKLLMSGSSQSR